MTIFFIGRPSEVAAVLAATLCSILCLSLPHSASAKDSNYEIIVHAGEVKKTIEYLKGRDFWGRNSHAKDIDVPRIIVAIASKNWSKESRKIPVQVKKELFYRATVPMILLANQLILEERKNIEAMDDTLERGNKLTAEDQVLLQEIAQRFGLEGLDTSQSKVSELLERVDTVPPSLALGQTAYESGYGTSRFAAEGNALFGQWTYGGKGMKPQNQRSGKGDYGVAAYDWPFDSVRSYMHNLNTHRAYQKLRAKRAVLRKEGKEVTGLALADTLDSYSERGMEYVKTLKSIIRVNHLGVADRAYLRDEIITLVVAVDGTDNIEVTEAKIAQLRASGELDRIIKGMQLDGKE